MVDLKGQYKNIKDRINQSVLDVIESTAFINGPEVHQFQKELEEVETPEFQNAISAQSFEATPEDIQFWFTSFDTNQDNSIDFMEFMNAVVGDLDQHRSDKVELAWRRINSTQAENVRITDIQNHYNGSRHPNVKFNERTLEEVIQEFTDTLIGFHEVWHKSQPQGLVKKDEFFNYFRILAINVC